MISTFARHISCPTIKRKGVVGPFDFRGNRERGRSETVKSRSIVL